MSAELVIHDLLQSSRLRRSAPVLALILGIFSAVCLALRFRGLRVQAGALCFIATLVCTQLLMKMIGSPAVGFKFPLLVTSLHFLSIWAYAWLYWALSKDCTKVRPASLGSLRRYAVFVCPVSLGLSLSVALNNQALLYMNAGLNSLVSMLAPIATALLSHCLGRKISRLGWLGVLTACLGAVVICWGELHNGQASRSLLLGLSFASASMLLRAVKVVLLDHLLDPAAYAKRNGSQEPKEAPPQPVSPLHVWALQAPPSFLVSATYCLSIERVPGAVEAITPTAGWLILGTCASATVLNVVSMHIIKELGASGMQIVGKLNTVIIMAISAQFLGEQLPMMVGVGAGTVVLGVGIFERASHHSQSAKFPHTELKQLDEEQAAAEATRAEDKKDLEPAAATVGAPVRQCSGASDGSLCRDDGG